MTLTFFLLAALVAAVVVLLLVRSLWRGAAIVGQAQRSAVNAAVYRDQLAELERDRKAGVLSDADFDQARRELQKRVLEEAAAPGEAPAAPARGARAAAVVLAVALPLAAMGTYFVLGNPDALAPQAPQEQVTAAQVEAMVASLAQRLKANPDDPQGWAMLGRSYRVMGRYGEAAEAFANAGKVVDENSQLLTEYAESLALAQQGNLTGKPSELLDKALKLDPSNLYARVLAGSAAYERADYALAVSHWEKVLAQLPAGSEEARSVADSIERAKAARTSQGRRQPAK
ncbi:MAG: c-type cytochrome biogenesis protein CcmI [Pseudomonadota bacterium]